MTSNPHWFSCSQLDFSKFSVFNNFLVYSTICMKFLQFGFRKPSFWLRFNCFWFFSFNNFDLRILIYIWSKPLCNERSLTMTSGYFLSTVAQNGHYQAQLVLSNFEKQVKAIEFLVVSRSYVWFDWLKANEFEFCNKRCKISRLWRKCGLPIHSYCPNRKSAKLINKYGIVLA